MDPKVAITSAVEDGWLGPNNSMFSGRKKYTYMIWMEKYDEKMDGQI
jgi:hypothetical protein